MRKLKHDAVRESAGDASTRSWEALLPARLTCWHFEFHARRLLPVARPLAMARLAHGLALLFRSACSTVTAMAPSRRCARCAVVLHGEPRAAAACLVWRARTAVQSDGKPTPASQHAAAEVLKQHSQETLIEQMQDMHTAWCTQGLDSQSSWLDRSSSFVCRDLSDEAEEIEQTADAAAQRVGGKAASPASEPQQMQITSARLTRTAFGPARRSWGRVFTSRVSEELPAYSSHAAYLPPAHADRRHHNDQCAIKTTLKLRQARPIQLTPIFRRARYTLTNTHPITLVRRSRRRGARVHRVGHGVDSTVALETPAGDERRRSGS